MSEGFPQLRYTFEPRQGKSFALNTGLAVSRGAIIAFTDDDCIVHPEWLRTIAEEFRSDAALACLGGRVELLDANAAGLAIRPARKRAAITTETFQIQYPALIGCNMAVRRAAVQRVGAFDVKLGPASRAKAAEDLDWGYRLCREGFKAVYAPDVLVYHDHGRASEHAVLLAERGYVMGRGAFYCKHIARGDTYVLRSAWYELYSDVRDILRGKAIRKTARMIYWLLRGACSRATPVRCEAPGGQVLRHMRRPRFGIVGPRAERDR
jgi:GT2 family glycosyltransferase